MRSRPLARRTVGYCIVVLFTALTVARSAQAQPLADRLPADTVVYVGWAGADSLGSQYEGSHLKAILDASNASKFVDEIPDGIEVGLVAFDGTARLLVEPTIDHESVITAVHTLTTGPRTATGEGIATALDSITSSLSKDALASDNVPASVVLLSDGYTTVGRSAEQAAQMAADLGVPITTIAYGTPTGTVQVQGQIVDVPADTSTMKTVAEMTGGRFFEATSAGELDKAYTDIRTIVGYTTEYRDVSRALFGAGLLVLIGSTPFAFVWAARAL